MEYRKTKYNQQGTIDAEVNHPQFGWIPTTLDPTDDVEANVELYHKILAEATVAPYVAPVLTAEQIKNQFSVAVDSYLNAVAQEKSYYSILSACSYAGAPNYFQEESQAFITWRGAVWSTAFSILADVEAGTRAVPTKEELIAELPIFEYTKTVT
jgi:hypothetical protein